MTKFTEHLRRRWLAIPVRVWALLGSLCSLSIALFVLSLSLNVVHVSDSDGNRRTLITTHDDPDQIMELSGIVAEAHDEVYYTAYAGNLASLSIQRAYPVYVEADGQNLTAQLCGGTVEDALDATGVSLALATEKPVAVAFDAGTLEAVAEALRAKFPRVAITICADNDHATERDGKPWNPGVEKAKAAAQKVGGKVIVPAFSEAEKAQRLTDFNDLHKSQGLGAVKRQVARAQEQNMER